MTISTRTEHMDLIFDFTKEEVETLQKTLNILDNIADEMETISRKETDFSEVSIIEKQSERWYSLIERIIVASIDINELLDEPIFKNSSITVEKREIDN